MIRVSYSKGEFSILLAANILATQPGNPSANYNRHPGPGESSRQPAFATRVAWTHNIFGQPLRVGTGGYYSRQDYGFSRSIDGWAAMTDIDLPLSRQFSLSGELYRGKGLGGLYGAGGRSALWSGDLALQSTQIKALDSVGGCGTIKISSRDQVGIQCSFRNGQSLRRRFGYFPDSLSYGDPTLARNRGSFVNMIYRPRSDLLFSGEYRYLTTYSTTGSGSSAGQINLMMGVLF